LDQAFRLRLMLDLIGGESSDATQLAGLGPTYAGGVIVNTMGHFPLHPLNHFGPRDWWAGVVVFQDEPKEGKQFRWSAWYAGEIEMLGAWIEEKRRREVPAEGRCEVARVFLANATRAARFVRDRAEEMGLPEAADFKLVQA